MMKILIATGGTGGHIIPALVTARVLKSRGHHIHFAGVFRQAAQRLVAEGFEFKEISAKGFTIHSVSDFVNFSRASYKSFFESAEIIKKIQPDCVAGFGGYGSFWIVWAAILQGVPTMIQEQNVKPGKANQLLSFFVRKIAVGFAQAIKYLPQKKTILTGCPLRPISAQPGDHSLLIQWGLPVSQPVVLVLGGSQGSRRINEAMISVMKSLKKAMSLSVIHICGEKDVAMCQKAYQQEGISCYVTGFTEDIDKIYSVADIVISRAGAMTVTELAAFHLPAVLIPYPYAGGHQYDNALVLAQSAVSVIIQEKDLSVPLLSQVISNILNKKWTKQNIQAAYQGIYHCDAADKIVKVIEALT